MQAFVHVSTAYANADKKDIQEIVYPLATDIRGEIKSGCLLSAEFLENIGNKMQRPNTYGISKAIAESIVAAYSDEIPIAIVRLSIGKQEYDLLNFSNYIQYFDSEICILVHSFYICLVTAAWREPFEGWVDNMNSATGIIMEIGRGTLRSLVADKHIIIDFIPVDLVANTLLVAAWYIGTNRLLN